MLTFANLQRNY